MKNKIAGKQTFHNHIINQMIEDGWKLGKPSNYDIQRAIYLPDVFQFIQTSQPEEWQKFKRLYSHDTKQLLLDNLVDQLTKTGVNITDNQSRTYGTLGVLRHGLKIGTIRFSLCQFKPEHNLNPETLTRYQQNICRIVPNLSYHQAENSSQPLNKNNKISLVLFVNGLPIATLEPTVASKQTIHDAISRYKNARLPKDPLTKKIEPLLSFKRGALVHFAVSPQDVYMTTKLEGDETLFLPFNKGTKEGGPGNDIPDEPNRYATDYLWHNVLRPDNLLSILSSYIHLEIKEKIDKNGLRINKENLIFPRFHQWDVVCKLLEATLKEGTGNKYLIQHSAGSGKSNSIAWTAHQLSNLYKENGEKQFHSVIVITDRTVLDDQLQDTIYQFEHADGVVGRITNKESGGSKAEKLAAALENSQPIIIVTIQTFLYVLKAIEKNINLRKRKYAVIADEAHSSQSGSTANNLKRVLMLDEIDNDDEVSSEEALSTTLASRAHNNNVNYYAFTATPKAKMLELFGRLPNPDKPPSKSNKPQPFHVYSMRQAIQEGFILDVLKNYTNYQIAYQLALKAETLDKKVDAQKAQLKLKQWIRLHDCNISEKTKAIVEHYKNHVMNLINGQAKAMIVTGSRKEAIRYKLAFDEYVAEKDYQNIHAIVAFSDDVVFQPSDPDSRDLLNKTFNENNMNPGLRNRDMREAFDSDDYQIMIVANKFQTGFDQPKLCAMYVDKPLSGVECVQTLSRLNRIYPGKAECGTFVVDFHNQPEEILKAFQPFYQTAELMNVTDPQQIFELFDKLCHSGIFLWDEVEHFCTAFFTKSNTNQAISNICRPAKERWEKRYFSVKDAYLHAAKKIIQYSETSKYNSKDFSKAETLFNACKDEKDRLETFKKALCQFIRHYEYMSQLVDYNDTKLEKLSLYARHLRPLLREQKNEESRLSLDNVVMTHYRLSKIREQDLKLKENTKKQFLKPKNISCTVNTMKENKNEYLSETITRLNTLFTTENLTDDDMVNYVLSIRDRLSKNDIIMTQIAHNTREQAMLGYFPEELDNAIMDSDEAHQEIMIQYLSNPEIAHELRIMMFELLKNEGIKTQAQ